MLHFAAQYSSSSSSSSPPTIHMELSVLDRQRSVLQRLHQTDHPWQQKHHFLDMVDRQPFQSHFLQTPKPHAQSQCNSTGEPIISSSPPNKRKAEFDVEEDKEKGGVEAEEEEGEEKSEITTKTGGGISSNTCSKGSEVKKTDYIHVRARRGQATDSHSLAERARREKISKKMKCLQDLVPGCNKVTGKAGMLDEIINYVQSLQKQVEFLSMKLATVNPRLDFSIDNIFAKEMPAYVASLPATAQFESANFQYNTMQQGTSGCGVDVAMDQSQMLSQKAGPIPEVFLDSSFISQLQQLSGWESDWPSLFS